MAGDMNFTRVLINMDKAIQTCICIGLIYLLSVNLIIGDDNEGASPWQHRTVPQLVPGW